MGKNFLIVHLVSNGDCLMMTTIAKQLKQDNPGCLITWAISYKCKQVIENNPDIDTIWEIKYKENENPLSEVWYKVKAEAEERREKGEFHRIIYSQIYPDNPHHFDGTTRSSVFRAYKSPLTVDVTPSMNLYPNEVERVRDFVAKSDFQKYPHVVLCECAPNSGQSFMSLPLMLQLAENIVKEREDIVFIISTHLKIKTNHHRIIDGSELSYRENAEISKYCTLLLGCSSGITWLLTSSWCPKINTIQFLSKTNIPFQFASVAYDFKYWGLSTDHILETDNKDIMAMQKIVDSALTDFKAARNTYNQIFIPDIQALKNNIHNMFLSGSAPSLKKILSSINIFLNRNNLSKTNFFYFLVLLSKIILKKRLRSLGHKNP